MKKNVLYKSMERVTAYDADASEGDICGENDSDKDDDIMDNDLNVDKSALVDAPNCAVVNWRIYKV